MFGINSGYTKPLLNKLFKISNLPGPRFLPSNKAINCSNSNVMPVISPDLKKNRNIL